MTVGLPELKTGETRTTLVPALPLTGQRVAARQPDRQAIKSLLTDLHTAHSVSFEDISKQLQNFRNIDSITLYPNVPNQEAQKVKVSIGQAQFTMSYKHNAGAGRKRGSIYIQAPTNISFISKRALEKKGNFECRTAWERQTVLTIADNDPLLIFNSETGKLLGYIEKEENIKNQYRLISDNMEISYE